MGRLAARTRVIVMSFRQLSRGGPSDGDEAAVVAPLADAYLVGAGLPPQGVGMALFARSRNHTREVELERRVNALQSTLNQCKSVARQWWGFRVRFTMGVAVVAMATGFTLGVYRHTIREALVETASTVGLARPSRDAAEEAEVAFQKGNYTKALTVLIHPK